MPQGWNQAPMQRVQERRVLHGYAIFPAPLEVTLYPDSGTITIDLQASGTDEYEEAFFLIQYMQPQIINVKARYAALRGRRW